MSHLKLYNLRIAIKRRTKRYRYRSRKKRRLGRRIKVSYKTLSCILNDLAGHGMNISKDHFFKARYYTRLHFMGIGVNHLVIDFLTTFPKIYKRYLGLLI